MNTKKCPHGLEVNPITNEHIFPNSKAATKEKTTAELITEARRLFAKQEPTIPVPKLSKRDKEIEESKKYYDKNYRGKIASSIFQAIDDY